MGPSDFYNFVLGTVGNMMGDPIAIDLATPTIVQLGSSDTAKHLLQLKH